MNLRSHITTSFLALAQALPAQAQEERTPYSTTRECAIQSLRENFSPFAIEVIEDEQGVGAFAAIGDGQLSSLIKIDPGTGLVSWIDVQTNADNPDVDLNSVAKLDYKGGTQNGTLTSDGTGRLPVEAAIGMTRKLDDAMRQCSQGMLLGSVAARSNFKLG